MIFWRAALLPSKRAQERSHGWSPGASRDGTRGKRQHALRPGRGGGGDGKYPRAPSFAPSGRNTLRGRAPRVPLRCTRGYGPGPRWGQQTGAWNVTHPPDWPSTRCTWACSISCRATSCADRRRNRATTTTTTAPTQTPIRAARISTVRTLGLKLRFPAPDWSSVASRWAISSLRRLVNSAERRPENWVGYARRVPVARALAPSRARTLLGCQE